MGGIRHGKKKFKGNSKRPRCLGEPKFDENGQPIDDRNTEEGKKMGYKEIVRENALYVDYYKAQNICPPEEFDSMIKTLQQDLPASFRVTGCRSQAKSLKNIMEGDFFKELIEKQKEGDSKVVAPKTLNWYPEAMAYQLNVTRKDIRREEVYFRLHNFLVAEAESGNISRQETVSMIPPIVLGVQPHHKVLDMCAAPGSKTTQLIEALHQEEGSLPTGFVIANDADNSRCYMLTHQVKRLQSPCLLITNHDATILPNLYVRSNLQEPESELKPIKFDRILCDVPCTGDATLRKNPDIWPKWNPSNGPNLHGIQYRVLKRGIELLELDGRLVYSTCSLNPVENEAVIHRLLKDAGGSVELLGISDCLPGLKTVPGISTWVLSDKQGKIYKSHEEVGEKQQYNLRPFLFPPTPEDAPAFNLERCIRVLPHHQNTGGFFVALLVKKKRCPWEKQVKVKKSVEGSIEEEVEGEDSDQYKEKEQKQKEDQPPAKKPKVNRYMGFKEDPFIYLQGDDPVFPEIKEYYGLELPIDCFLSRCADTTKKKNLYFTTPQIKEIVEQNKDRVKIINTGVKAFTKCEHKGATCDFRIAQEGCLMTLDFIKKRKLYPGAEDMMVLLQNSDFDAPPENKDMSEAFRKQLEECETGSVALIYTDKDQFGDPLKVEVVGWKGKSSVRAYVPKNERLHFLRMVGGDLSKYDKNKFDSKKERQEERLKKANGENSQNGADDAKTEEKAKMEEPERMETN